MGATYATSNARLGPDQPARFSTVRMGRQDMLTLGSHGQIVCALDDVFFPGSLHSASMRGRPISDIVIVSSSMKR